MKKPILLLRVRRKPFLNALTVAESMTHCSSPFERSMTRSEKWAQPQRKRVPPVQIVFVVQSAVERRRTAAILSVVEVVADLPVPGMAETMRAVS